MNDASSTPPVPPYQQPASQPWGQPPYPPVGTGPAPKPPVRTVDLVATVIELVALVLVAGGAMFLGLFLAFFSDSCSDTPGSRCDDGRLTQAIALATISPATVTLVAVVVSVVLLVRRRLAWWVPWVAFVVGAGLWVGAYALAASSVNQP